MWPRRREYVNCPVRVSLDRPLGERAVIDVDDDEELPVYAPKDLNSDVQPDHGYHPANRDVGAWAPSRTPPVSNRRRVVVSA